MLELKKIAHKNFNPHRDENAFVSAVAVATWKKGQPTHKNAINFHFGLEKKISGIESSVRNALMGGQSLTSLSTCKFGSHSQIHIAMLNW